MPYTTIRHDVVTRQFEQDVRPDRTEWDILDWTFILFDSSVIDIEFAETDTPTPATLALRAYWDNRGATVSERYELWSYCAGESIIGEINQAYDATRHEVTVQVDEPAKKKKSKRDA